MDGRRPAGLKLQGDGADPDWEYSSGARLSGPETFVLHRFMGKQFEKFSSKLSTFFI